MASPPRTVVVTGCDSGLGALLAVQLFERGFHVFAGCLTAAGIERLDVTARTVAGGKGRLRAFRLDVTSDDSVKAAFALVRSELAEPRLFALVNNAGIFMSGPVDWMRMEDYQKMMDVNFFGCVRTVKAFLPLLMARSGGPGSSHRGRIVNVSSVAGLIAGPHLSAYHASKYAIEGWSDSLRREVAPYGLHVSLIEPSFLRTPMLAAGHTYQTTSWANCPADVKARWGEAFATESMGSRALTVAEQQAEPGQVAVDAMIAALTASSPRLRYRPNWLAKTFYAGSALLPGALVDFAINLGTRLVQKHKPVWATQDVILGAAGQAADSEATGLLAEERSPPASAGRKAGATTKRK